MITIILDNSSGTYQAIVNDNALAGGRTPAEAMRALAEVLDRQDATAAADAKAAQDAAEQLAVLGE